MPRSIRTILLPIVALILLLVPACTNYYPYAPQPAVLMLRPNPQNPADQTRILLNVAGIRKPPDHKQPVINVIIRIENLGRSPLTFAPEKTAALDARLQSLPGPVGDLQPAAIDPEQVMLRTLQFPLPKGMSPGDPSLSMLNVRWTLHADNRDWPYTAVFYRIEYPGYYYYGAYPAYPYPYSYPYYYW